MFSDVKKLVAELGLEDVFVNIQKAPNVQEGKDYYLCGYRGQNRRYTEQPRDTYLTPEDAVRALLELKNKKTINKKGKK